MNIRRSLVTKYLMLILASILMWPVLPALYYLPGIFPRSTATLAIKPVYGDRLLILLIFVAGVSLVTVSLLFFLSIRKRIVKLQKAMSDTGNSGIPDEISVNNSDEIGQMEKAFNRMVTQLKSSRAREKEEESLRKLWIANLSHDLRTPMTVIQQHAYTVQRNPSSPQATKSMQIIINKLNDIGKLLDNLLTYTLLSAGKHPIKREMIDVIEELHHAAVEWYPVLEKEGFEVAIDLPDQALNWNVDPLWLRCILDNLVQNAIRYAKSGQYIGIGVVERNGILRLYIEDRGEGIKHDAEAKGAGIGLSIVSFMTKEMDIDWEISSHSNGLSHFLSQNLN